MTRERDELQDDVVARAWREHMRETPPAALDDAIRAAARRAVGAKPREKPLVAEAREPWRWWMPLAAAATIGAIAIGVLQNLPQDTGEPTVVSDATTARRAAPAPAPASPSAPTLRASVDEPATAGSMRDAPAPKGTVDAMRAPSPEQRDRVPLPLPRAEAPRMQAPAPMRQEAAKPDARPRADAPSEAKEAIVAPTADDKLVASAPQPPVAALEKRADEVAPLPRKNERDAASGFVASPPASEPAVVATAKQAVPASPPPPSAAGGLGAAREPVDTMDATTRAKVRAAPERAAAAPAPASASKGVRATAEPQAMAVTPPDVFIAEIRRLLAANDREGAVRELQRFRRTHADADARLPVDLRDFAATVAR